MSDTSKHAPPGPRNFGQFVSEHEDGRFHNAASTAMHDLLVQLREAAGMRGGTAKAKMTITLDFEMDGENIEVVADIQTKLPKLKRGRSIWWITPEGHLCRSNPAQPELNLRDVTSGPGAAVARSLA
jgi:hypothetical protein